MEPRVWINPRQPQTLYIAHLLLYFRGGSVLVFAVLFGSSLTVFSLLFALGSVLAAFGIANERSWGYRTGVAVASLTALLSLVALIDDLDRLGRLLGQMFGLLFDIALVALLLHPMSRHYQRYWPKRPSG